MGEGGEEIPGHIAFEGSKSHESTPARAKFLYARRDLFPNMPIAGWAEGDDDKLTEEWAWVLAPKNANEQGLEVRRVDYSQKKYGRASFIPMIFEARDGTRFSLMYRRGGGGANGRAGDFNADNYEVPWEGKPGNMALGDRNTTLVEAEKRSTMLHEKGIRVRLPIMGFEIEGVYTKDGYKTIEELVESGVLNPDYLVNKPVESYWAKKNSYTFWDAMSTEDIDGLLQSQTSSLRTEKDDRSNRVADLIEAGKGEREWFYWLIDKGAEQVSAYAREGFMHPAFTGQNIDLSIETGDVGDADESFEMRPLCNESSDSDKYMFAMQMSSMLALIVELKDHFDSQHGFDPYKKKKEMIMLISRYVAEIAKSNVGMLMVDHILKKPDEVEEFATILPLKDLFVAELKKASWLNRLRMKLGVILRD